MKRNQRERERVYEDRIHTKMGGQCLVAILLLSMLDRFPLPEMQFCVAVLRNKQLCLFTAFLMYSRILKVYNNN
jgi:hypothetical protein